MEIRERTIIPLDYGRYVRADRIIALDPIEDDRGPGRRAQDRGSGPSGLVVLVLSGTAATGDFSDGSSVSTQRPRSLNCRS